MSGPFVTAAAHLDAAELRVRGGRGTDLRAAAVDPGSLRWRAFFQDPHHDFRRLDATSRAFVILAEALDLARHLAADLRDDTALVLATATGCLAADRRFQRSLESATGPEPAVFPYTLPSTCLGEIALRHGLRGPTLCLSVGEGGEAAGIDAALDLLDAGEARAAIVLLGDWCPPDRTRAAALLLAPGDPDTPHALAVRDARPFGLEQARQSTSPCTT